MQKCGASFTTRLQVTCVGERTYLASAFSRAMDAIREGIAPLAPPVPSDFFGAKMSVEPSLSP